MCVEYRVMRVPTLVGYGTGSAGSAGGVNRDGEGDGVSEEPGQNQENLKMT
jgi:hypothetical protein